MSRPVLFWIAVLFVVAGGTIFTLALRGTPKTISGSQGEIDTEYLNSPDYKNQDWLKEFTLTERSGRKVSSKELLGRPYIVSFFYTSCPTECLQQNAKLGELARTFKDTDFVFLSISCDPETDTPARLREYARHFQADEEKWMFLTGELAYLQRVAAEMYRVPLDKQSHTERFIAVDRAGQTRKQFAWKQPAQMIELEQLMRELLDEKWTPADETPAPEDSSITPAEAPSVEKAVEE